MNRQILAQLQPDSLAVLNGQIDNSIRNREPDDITLDIGRILVHHLDTGITIRDIVAFDHQGAFR